MKILKSIFLSILYTAISLFGDGIIFFGEID